MISSEAEHPNCMYQWMNYILDPKANAEVAEWFGEAPANEKSCALMGDLPAVYGGTADYCETTTQTTTGVLEPDRYWMTPVADCGDDRGDVCKTYNEWVHGWTEIKG